MESISAEISYDPRTIRLHWITAALVTVLWGIAQIIDWCRPFGTQLLVQAFPALKRWAKVGRPSAPVLWRAPRQVLVTILSCCNESCLINPILR